MSIVTGQNIIASDFINQAAKNATPSSDAGRGVKLEPDGRLSQFFTRNGAVLNCGETLNGATSPVPVYQNKTDNELYACDGNDTNKLKFVGFVTSNGTDGNPATFQGAGVVSGFTSLAEGEKYYVQDAVGTIGTTPGTYEVLVGVAISETDLLIMKGRRFASGVQAFSSVTTQTITVGFRASKVTIHAYYADETPVSSHGNWTKHGGNSCAYSSDTGTPSPNIGSRTDYSWWLARDESPLRAMHGLVDTITDTTFRLNSSADDSAVAIILAWEAEGEL